MVEDVGDDIDVKRKATYDVCVSVTCHSLIDYNELTTITLDKVTNHFSDRIIINYSSLATGPWFFLPLRP
jgi:hypothetical protein